MRSPARSRYRVLKSQHSEKGPVGHGKLLPRFDLLPATATVPRGVLAGGSTAGLTRYIDAGTATTSHLRASTLSPTR